MLNRADIVAFVATTKPERARAFYEGVLGLSLLADEPFALVFDANGVTLRVAKVQALDPAPHTVLGWSVADIRGTIEGLTKKEVVFEHYDGLPQDQMGVCGTRDWGQVLQSHIVVMQDATPFEVRCSCQERSMDDAWSAWPEDIRPDRAPVYTRNSLDMDAPPKLVWAHLIRAEAWPEFYANSRDVRVEGSEGPDLGPGRVFTWRTFGLRVRTKVEVFEPEVALAWRGDEFYGRGMHTWILTKTERGCRVVTEEVQCGFVPWIGRWYLRRGLLRWHQRWLEGLRDRALSGSPS